MASQEIKHRNREDQPKLNVEKNDVSTNNGSKARRQKRTAMAKRGLRSLAIAVALPLSLTLANVSLFGSSGTYRSLHKPLWFPSLWTLHLTCLVSSFLMGLSAWLVWADGGFHRNPTVLALYLAQLVLALAWDPVVLRMGANGFGLILCLALFGVMAACCRVFREVNPIAGDLIKPCLVWSGFLALVNLKLVYL